MVTQAAMPSRISKPRTPGESSIRRTAAAAPVTTQATASGLRAIPGKLGRGEGRQGGGMDPEASRTASMPR